MAGPNSEVTFHGDLNIEPATDSETEQSSRSMSLDDFINNLCFSEDVRARAHARGTTPAAAIMNRLMRVPRRSPVRANNGPTLTLEDFLVQAGLPNCPRAPPPPQPPQPRPQQQQPPVGMYPNRHGEALGIPAYMHHPFGNPAYWRHPFGNPAYRHQALGLAHGVFDYQRSGVRAPPAPAVSYVAVGPPVSPLSSDGESPVQVGTGSRCGQETGMVGGQQREADSTKDKVVERHHIESPMERRQRKMKKHRESAARSRAMKHAHLVGLEIDHKQLTQENQQLKQTVVELLNKLSQQCGRGSTSRNP